MNEFSPNSLALLLDRLTSIDHSLKNMDRKIETKVDELRKHVDDIKSTVDKANPDVIWEKLETLEKKLSLHETQFQQQRGAMRALNFVAVVIGAGIGWLVKLFSGHQP